MTKDYDPGSNVAARKEYGLELRKAMLGALPASVTQIAERIGRSRAATLHHVNKLIKQGAVFRDEREYPPVIRCSK